MQQNYLETKWQGPPNSEQHRLYPSLSHTKFYTEAVLQKTYAEFHTEAVLQKVPSYGHMAVCLRLIF